MTLNEALQIIGAYIIVSIGKLDGHDMANLLLSHAIIEEWFDGRLENFMTEQITTLVSDYGENTVRQAARVLANKTEIYGDLNE